MTKEIEDAAFEELAGIIVDGFLTSPKLAKHKKHDKTVKETFKTSMLENKSEVQISLERFHAWMHKWKIEARAEVKT